LAANAVIAIVDDDDLVRASLAGYFRSFGVTAEAFSSAASFLAGGPDRFDIVVSDLQMPGMSGLDLRKVLSEREAPLPVIIVTAFPERAKDVSGTGVGLPLLEKPVDGAQLVTVSRRSSDGRSADAILSRARIALDDNAADRKTSGTRGLPASLKLVPGFLRPSERRQPAPYPSAWLREPARAQRHAPLGRKQMTAGYRTHEP